MQTCTKKEIFAEFGHMQVIVIQNKQQVQRKPSVYRVLMFGTYVWFRPLRKFQIWNTQTGRTRISVRNLWRILCVRQKANPQDI